MKHRPENLFAVLLLLLAACQSPRSFQTGYRHYGEKNYEAAATIFRTYSGHPVYAAPARYFLGRIQLSGNPGLPEYLALDDRLLEADSLLRLLKPKKQARIQRRYEVDTSAFAELRERVQRQLIAHVRVRGTLPALDSLLDGLVHPLPALQPAIDQTRSDIVGAHLESTDYDVLTLLVKRHLAAVRPEFYGKSRRLSERLWPAFLDKYSLCEIGRFAADHPRSFIGRDCWRADLQPVLCRKNMPEMLAFREKNRWTALESVLINAISDASAGFTATTGLDSAQQIQVRDLARRSVVLNSLRKRAADIDTVRLLAQGTEYITRYAPRYSAFRLMEDMLQFFLEEHLYDSGVRLLTAARPFFPDTLPAFCKTNFDYQLRVRPWIDAKLPILEKPFENLKKVPLDAMNTPEGDEFSPVLSADGASLYFGGAGRPGNVSGQDVFVSRRAKDGQWSAPEIVPALSGDGNQYPLSLTADGRQMLISADGVLSVARRNGQDWGSPTPLPLAGIPVIGKGVFSADGNMIALEGSYTAGDVLNGPDIDIFLVFRDASTGQWGRPMALGSAINTEEQEGNPYLSADGQTLYYTSAGYPGLGKSDVFVSFRTGEHRANDWTRARNLGKEVNDTWPHTGLSALSPDRATAFFAQKQANSDNRDIWLLELPADCRPGKH